MRTERFAGCTARVAGLVVALLVVAYAGCGAPEPEQAVYLPDSITAKWEPLGELEVSRAQVSQVSPWSPTAPKLAVWLADLSDPGMAIVNPLPWAVDRITGAGQTPPAWSPDGSALAVIDVQKAATAGEFVSTVRLVDSSDGSLQRLIDLRPSPGCPPIFVTIDIIWSEPNRWFFSTGCGTSLAALWRLESGETHPTYLTFMHMRFDVLDEQVAFEVRRRGGMGVGVVAATGRVQWYNPNGVQFLSDGRPDGILLTAWGSFPDSAARPNLVSWVLTPGQSRARILRKDTGWGTWNHDKSLIAALDFGPDRVVTLVVLDDSGQVRLRIPLGSAPEADGGEYWHRKRNWFDTRQPRWSPVDNRLLFVDGPGNLWLLDVDTAQLVCALPEAAQEVAIHPAPSPTAIHWSRDGRFAALLTLMRMGEGEGEAARLRVLQIP